MAKQFDLDNTYMQVAYAHASLSKGVRAKVGACIVTETGVILAGYNGLSPGGDNKLEYEQNGSLVTKPEVIHAELNCILKAAKEGVSITGGTLYVTLTPCIVCSEMIIAAGIKRVVFHRPYRCDAGVRNLINRGLAVVQLQMED